MDDRVDVAFVTGAAGGLGVPIVRRLAADGFHVVAAAVSFLCSADAAFVTGQTLNVDGGWKMM